MSIYDTNYINKRNDDDEEPVSEGMAEDDNVEDEYDDTSVSDDVDMSWKVGHVAITCLLADSTHRPVANFPCSRTGTSLDVGESIMVMDQSDAVEIVLYPLATRSPQVLRSIRKQISHLGKLYI